jgi:hypothetical protein
VDSGTALSLPVYVYSETELKKREIKAFLSLTLFILLFFFELAMKTYLKADITNKENNVHCNEMILERFNIFRI